MQSENVRDGFCSSNRIVEEEEIRSTGNNKQNLKIVKCGTS